MEFFFNGDIGDIVVFFERETKVQNDVVLRGFFFRSGNLCTTGSVGPSGAVGWTPKLGYYLDPSQYSGASFGTRRKNGVVTTTALPYGFVWSCLGAQILMVYHHFLVCSTYLEYFLWVKFK